MFGMGLIRFQPALLQQGNLPGYPPNQKVKHALITISEINKDSVLNFVTQKDERDSVKYFINENVESSSLKEISGEKLFDDYIKLNVTVDSGSGVCNIFLEIIYSIKEEKIFYRNVCLNSYQSDAEIGDPGRGAVIYPSIKVDNKLPINILKPYLSKIDRKFDFLVIYWFTSDNKYLLDEYLKLHKYFSGTNTVVFLAIDWNYTQKEFVENPDYCRYDESSLHYLNSVFPEYVVVDSSGKVVLDRKGLIGDFLPEYQKILAEK